MLRRTDAWLVVVAATLTMTVSYVDRQTFSVLAPSVTSALDIGDTGYGVLVASFSIAYLLATPLAGWWVDRVGARRGLVLSVLVWSAIASLHSLALGFGSMFVLRIMLGIAEGPGFPGAAQTVQRALPPADRPRGFGLLFAGSSIGSMIAAPLAAWLYRVSGWRTAFLGTAIVGLSWLPMWIVLTGRSDVRARLDASPKAGAGAGSIRTLIANPVMIRALVGIFAVAPVLGFGLSWAAMLLAREFGVAQGQVGHFLWLPPLMLDLGAFGFGDLAARQRRAPGAPPRGLYAIAGVLAASLMLVPLSTEPWQAVELISIALGGVGAIFSLVTSDLLARVPAETVALAGGILACAQSLAYIIANPLIGACVDHFHGYTQIALVLGGWVIPGTIAWIVWPIRPAGDARQ